MTPFRVVIPARYGSSRLPGKPLELIAGKAMVLHVCERAVESGAAEVIVATDDRRIADLVGDAGFTACLTAGTHVSGTDRIAEVARIRKWEEAEVVVNLQGDEPLMPPQLIRQVAEDLVGFSPASMATLATPIQERADLFDPNVVKVVLDGDGWACYFSRAPIPWHRDDFARSSDHLPADVTFLRHVGLYAYRAGFLQRFVSWDAAAIERAESLEQLRALWHGERIHVTVTDHPPGHGVDTPRDLERVGRLFGDQLL